MQISSADGCWSTPDFNAHQAETGSIPLLENAQQSLAPFPFGISERVG